MNKFLKNTALSAVLALAALPAVAQNNLIEGYFRIQNVGNSSYVEVTGPFTAKPNVEEEDAQKSAGTIMYVEAVQDRDSYRLTHLRCQGIDVAMDDAIKPEEYQDALMSILDGDSPAYGLVREGFKYGYTSIARATVGTVLWFVASRLEKHVNDADKEGNEDYKFYAEDYIEVANDFNKNVTASLDLGLRLKPVEGRERTVQLYFDVPSLQPVVDWYKDEGAVIKGEVSRHEVFASAMRSMSYYLGTQEINLETFLPEDISLLESWNYNVTEGYSDHLKDGSLVLTFDQIFSDPVLLFNWIKMVGYYILNPDKDTHGLAALGFGDLGSSLQNHYLTNLLVQYLPRLHYNTRAFLINGRVGAPDQFGGEWTDADNTLGFASDIEINTADKNGMWKLEPVDNDKQKFFVDHIVSYGGESYSAHYYDFPVSAVEGQDAYFHNLKSASENISWVTPEQIYNWNVFESLGKNVGRQVPFILQSNNIGMTVQLNVADGKWKFEPLASTGTPDPEDPEEPEIEEVPDNSMIVGGDDDYTTGMYSFGAGVYEMKADDAAVTSDSNLKGIMLPTSLNNNDMSNLWGEESGQKVYTLQKDTQQFGASVHLYFAPTSETSLANTAVYKPTYPVEQAGGDYVLINEPPKLSGVEDVIIDNVEDDVIYDLRGIRVTNPLPGNIYIKNGKKILL